MQLISFRLQKTALQNGPALVRCAAEYRLCDQRFQRRFLHLEIIVSRFRLDERKFLRRKHLQKGFRIPVTDFQSLLPGGDDYVHSRNLSHEIREKSAVYANFSLFENVRLDLFLNGNFSVVCDQRHRIVLRADFDTFENGRRRLGRAGFAHRHRRVRKNEPFADKFHCFPLLFPPRYGGSSLILTIRIHFTISVRFWQAKIFFVGNF